MMILNDSCISSNHNLEDIASVQGALTSPPTSLKEHRKETFKGKGTWHQIKQPRPEPLGYLKMQKEVSMVSNPLGAHKRHI